jgi:predicted nucleic acid-binding protein
MDSSPIVCNAGPLIALSLVGQLQILPALFKSILVPEAVWHEVVDSGFGRAGAEELKTAQWIEVVPSILVDSFLEADLGHGESQVIAVARAREAALVLIDELLARRVAGQVYGLGVKGSAGILVQAKKAGMIPAVRPLLGEMKKHGYYLSARLIERACSEASE